jgi:hypothetical protein
MKHLLPLLFAVFTFTSSYPQTNNLIDKFGDHTLAGWYWGGNLTMKYSHETDNIENGYAEIFSNDVVGPNSFVGLIRKDARIQVAQDNILSLMLQGTGSEVTVIVQLLYDKNMDGKYDEATDARLESRPITLNFSGWKEIHLNISESEFKALSKSGSEDFSLLEDEALGIQLGYQTGTGYPNSKLFTGIALISERPNKETKQEIAQTQGSSDESAYDLKNYPNPFNVETTISYTLKSATNVKITVYDRLGREVAVLFDGPQNEGEQSVSFNASNLPSGIYFYRLKTTEHTEVKKMVLTK